MATQQDALTWLNGGWKTDKYTKTITAAGGLGIDVDGQYGFQCKDFANAYGDYLGSPLPAGNAIILAQELNPGWSWVITPEAGDLGVRNYVSGNINYGDVVAVLGVNGSMLNTIGQNQVDSNLTIGHVPTTGVNPASAFIKFLRFGYQGDGMNITQEEYDDFQNWKTMGQALTYTRQWQNAGGVAGSPTPNVDSNLVAIMSDDAKYSDWVKAQSTWQADNNLDDLEVVKK